MSFGLIEPNWDVSRIMINQKIEDLSSLVNDASLMKDPIRNNYLKKTKRMACVNN